ncbi:MAG: hypothetical protein JSW58_04125 [Candidatus Latescibacterota bacterium]|nr:MAG: hypothetical protein JSW58_04125 [Candidatus Latescibacterota bacterium]
MKLRSVLVLMIIVMTAPTVRADSSQTDFSGYWHDGKAEMDGYRLTVSRYGQPRAGTCVMIYVTEPFSDTRRVKVEDPDRDPGDTFDVLKLNLIRDFQTGVYDYNTMVSVFVRSSDFSPVKVSFTSAEWCGHVYEELLFYPEKITGYYHSYFENESGPRELENPNGGVIEDNLFILLRGLRGDFLEPGGERDIQLLPSVFSGRLAHTPLRWVDAKISRDSGTRTIEVPAGDFETMVYTLATSEGREGTFFVEDAYPHRIIRWEMPADIEGEFTGSKRLRYWVLNKNGDEKHLRDIGLE